MAWHRLAVSAVAVVVTVVVLAGSAQGQHGECADRTETCADPDQLEFGWVSRHSVPASHAFVNSQKCTIPRVDLSQDAFLRSFHNRYPVIFRGEDNSEFRQLTSRQSLQERFGNLTITLSTANTFSHAKHRSTLSHYVHEHMGVQPLGVRADATMYHFGDNNYTEWNSLFEAYRRPSLHSETYEIGTLAFGLGGTGSGVNFHTHGPAYAEVIHGAKRWFLYKPNHTPSPIVADAMTTQQWLHDLYPALEDDNIPLECTCEVGDVLYIPGEWFHATLNIGESVFVSTFT